MEELLPGLVKVMEERLGKFGRPLSTVFVLSLAFGVIGWTLKFIWDNILSPVSQFVLRAFSAQPAATAKPLTETLVELAVSFLIASFITLVVALVGRYVVLRPISKARKEAEKTLEKADVILSLVRDIQDGGKKNGM